ncbi:MAG: HAD-IA family hydrolase [Elusimicrobia bacterium]|nr:HAD-IA family hydrolase [Elusimicrobiota bacterium]
MESILFDFGGTLDSDGTPWLERFRRIYEEEGLAAPPARFDRAFYDSDDELPSRHRLRGLGLADTVRLQVAGVLERLGENGSRRADRICERFLADCRACFRRNRPELERLALGGRRLGIVSNFYGNLDSVLASEGLGDLFAAVIDSGAAGVTKPEPAIFRLALDQLGSTCAQSVMVGDSVPRDMRGAESLGMAHVLIGPLSRPPCCPMGLRARSVSELSSRLQPRPIRAGIIAAGAGSRLRQAHPGLIKPLVPVRGRPLCHWIVDSLAAAGARDITILLNSGGRRVRQSLLAAFPSLRWTFLERDTASSWESFRLVAQTLAAGASPFLISTVDALIAPADARLFAQTAASRAAPAALALTGFVEDEKPLWADLAPDGRVEALGAAAVRRQYVTCGMYYLTPAAARAMPPAEAHGALREYLGALASRERVAGVILPRTLDVDRPEDVRQAEEFLAAQNQNPAAA